MRISSLRLEQFRSYDRLDTAFPDRGIELFTGVNGSGKTNIVEAVSYLSVGRSCLGVSHEHAMRWGTEFFRLRAGVQRDNGEEFSIEFAAQVSPRKERAAFVNDVRVPFVQFVGQLPTVIFLPQDLDLFTGSPQRRRGFTDAVISQLRPQFLQARLEFERILKQRNALLRRISEGEAGESDLDPWDAQLSRHGAMVQQERIQLMDGLQPLFVERLLMLGESWKDVSLVYRRSTVSAGVRVIETELQSLLAASRRKDVFSRTTSVGPHRDDWHVSADGHDIAVFASRGQQRSSLLALLLSATSVFESQRGEKPVVILDDVFSELDDHHQQSLLSALEGTQVLLTSTHVPQGVGNAKIWDVGKGLVLAKGG